jgi:5-methylcytosine-specific restriction endonuclease McrBC GTP-binding regulatory subunit McrB
MDYKEHHELNKEFLKMFPLEKLKDMTIEQYTNLNKSDSFCYWLEFKSKILGSVGGSNSYKFGIYRYNQKPKDNTSCLYDDKYTWWAFLGNTASEAFEKVKKAVILAAESGRDGNLNDIEAINNEIGPMIKWKIAFIYSNEKIIPYYSFDRLRVIGEKMGMPIEKNTTIADIQRFLINKRNGRDIHEYGEKLDEIWKEYEAHSKLWMWNGDENTFQKTEIRCGSSAKGQLKFETYKNKKELSNDYQNVIGNDDISIPLMYWQFLKEMKQGDIVVVFSTRKENGSQYHLLYGWGRIKSDVEIDYSNENPMSRNVEWCSQRPSTPIIDRNNKNALYIHKIEGDKTAYIMNLLKYNKSDGYMTDSKNIDEYIQLLKSNKNLVLTGAPGTGKTYMAKQIAKILLDVDDDDELQKDKRYGFVQFHPSYDYTDFVEGLRPIRDSQGNVGFIRQDGIFKAFCKQAILTETADAETLCDINDNPNVWKVSLGGTYENPTRTDCLENGYIRIGWHDYGDIEDFNDYEDFQHGGKNVLRAFQSGMQIGDLIVSCYSSKEVDAIGVVTGEYEYRAEGGDYPRYRNVKWLVKGIKENILDINNNKTFTLSTVYKASITAEDALKIVQKYSSKNIAETSRKDIAIFIIDEINRGEISKIFGELFFSIDPGYRGVAGRVKTQYQNLIEEGDAFKDGFYVPENVYIIGTMNDIDRSVESMDFAMRRRFAWKEVTAEDSMKMLDGAEYEEEAKKRMQNLNAAIIKVRGLGKAYQIGAAYFKKIKDYHGDFQKLWDFHLKGLLYEYLRGNMNAEEQLKELFEAYKS